MPTKMEDRIRNRLGYDKGSLLDAGVRGSILAAKGLKFVHGSIRQIRNQQNLPERVQTIRGEIKTFAPARKKLGHEYNYQLSLHQWLKRPFPSAVIERQKGSSRPDIVIDDVAIEVKGPTGTRELQTIADKIIRYGQHFEQVIIVLFELNVTEQRYDEWVSAIRRFHPETIVIVK